VNLGSCHSCSSGNQTATDNASNNTTQVIVQYAPSTAVATAINYGRGSASATAVAAPKLSASQSINARVNDPASNVGFGRQSAHDVTSNETNQFISQNGTSNANAFAVSFNGHASAVAVAAPTLIASQSANEVVEGSADNIGLGGSCGRCRSGRQSANNVSTNDTSQSITQFAPTTASASAVSGGHGFCGCGSGSGNATAIAIARPTLVASQTSTDKVFGKAINVGFGQGRQSANNVSANFTDQDISQNGESNAEANAINAGFGFGNHQSATAVAVAQPSELAVQGTLNVVTGSALNSALGFGCDCFFGNRGRQTADNVSINHTDQNIDQNGESNAEANAFNGAFGFGNHQFATAVAVAAPRLSASELSSALVSGVATNVGLGRGNDQFALNVTVNRTDQNIDQNGRSHAKANAVNLALGFGNSQSSDATAIADPSLSAGERASSVASGEAINTDLGSSCDFCDLFGRRGHQVAVNLTISKNHQSIRQDAPARVTASAFNGGISFDLGGWLGCGCGSFDNFGDFGIGNRQNATAIAASGANLRASETLNSVTSGRAANVGLGGRNDQVAINATISDNHQAIKQIAPSHVHASATNLPDWGFGGNDQNATAIAASAPVLSANEALSSVTSGSATNVNTGHDDFGCGCDFGDFGSCGCDRGGEFGLLSSRRHHGTDQVAINLSLSHISQKIVQVAPTDVTARAVNFPVSHGGLRRECRRCEFGFGGVQNATAIAAANPILAASETDISHTQGSATNVSLGTGCSRCDFFGRRAGEQVAINTTLNFPSQHIVQVAPAWVSAKAENKGFGFDGDQQAFAAAVSAPRLAASQIQFDNVKGSATNVSLGSRSGHQIAINTTFNDGDQSIKQIAPTHVDATAENRPERIVWDECGCDFGLGGDQNATAIAGAAPVLTASQTQFDTAFGSATNLDLSNSCGFCSFGRGARQFALNHTSNDVDQSIKQIAPSWVDARAENEGLPFIWGCDFECFGGPQNATAIATASPVLHANQWADASVHGSATNVNLGSSFGRRHHRSSNQIAINHSDGDLDQDLLQLTPAWSDAFALNTPSFLIGPWGEFGGLSCGACGAGPFGPSLAGFRSNEAFVPTLRAPSISTPLTIGGSPLTGLGTNFNLAGVPNLGIKLGLSVTNSEALNLPTIGQLLHGVTLFGLLHGLVTVNLSLSVTTPWVQVATAVAHESPFAVLFSVSAQHNLAPWYGYLL
jgi:hypothetical protein